MKDTAITTIDDYILAQDEPVQDRLWAVYNAIATAIPDAEARISWKMPTFWKGRNIIHFAAGKKHIGIYPGPDTVEYFRPRLQEYKTSKGAIQLPNSRELPLDLIMEIAVWSYERNRK